MENPVVLHAVNYAQHIAHWEFSERMPTEIGMIMIIQHFCDIFLCQARV